MAWTGAPPPQPAHSASHWLFVYVSHLFSPLREVTLSSTLCIPPQYLAGGFVLRMLDRHETWRINALLCPRENRRKVLGKPCSWNAGFPQPGIRSEWPSKPVWASQGPGLCLPVPWLPMASGTIPHGEWYFIYVCLLVTGPEVVSGASVRSHGNVRIQQFPKARGI